MSEQNCALSTLSEDAQIVRLYLEASMKPVSDLATNHIDKNTIISFTGGKVLDYS